MASGAGPIRPGNEGIKGKSEFKVTTDRISRVGCKALAILGVAAAATAATAIAFTVSPAAGIAIAIMGLIATISMIALVVLSTRDKIHPPGSPPDSMPGSPGPASSDEEENPYFHPEEAVQGSEVPEMKRTGELSDEMLTGSKDFKLIKKGWESTKEEVEQELIRGYQIIVNGKQFQIDPELLAKMRNLSDQAQNDPTKAQAFNDAETMVKDAASRVYESMKGAIDDDALLMRCTQKAIKEAGDCLNEMFMEANIFLKGDIEKPLIITINTKKKTVDTSAHFGFTKPTFQEKEEQQTQSIDIKVHLDLENHTGHVDYELHSPV